jgi:hypothetical protein
MRVKQEIQLLQQHFREGATRFSVGALFFNVVRISGVEYHYYSLMTNWKEF